MMNFIKRRYLLPIGIWLVAYMSLFLYLEARPPQEVHLIHCALDDLIPFVPAFIYPYLSWFVYIPVCAYLAMKNLEDPDYRRAVFVLVTGMNIFLIISFAHPTGLALREGIACDLTTLSGNLMKFVQTVDAPKSVFPSMHVYVTLVLQYTLEMQKKILPRLAVLIGRIVAALIVLSTMFTKQHSAVDVIGAIVMFAVLAGISKALSGKCAHRR